jgi:hypothetical protein
MSRSVEITRDELSAADLRQAALRSRDGRMSCRLLALAAVLEGASRAAAASAHGVDRQTLRDWVHRDNAEGIAGLTDRPRMGRPAALSGEQMREVKALVLAGPVRCETGWCVGDALICARRLPSALRYRCMNVRLANCCGGWA